jgi:hypothetical protein
MRVAWLGLTGLALLGCGGVTPSASDAGPSDFFIARQIDFKNFRQWNKYKVYAAVDAGEPVDAGAGDAGPTDPNVVGAHAAGDRYAYINKLPPPGSAAFPTGTIILKVTEGPDGKELPRLHAMVKRNGGFNADGAVGWEWMELVLGPDQPPVILWRDTHPPTEDGYQDPMGGGLTGDCNACHAVAKDNDYVQGATLRLSAF